MPPVELAVNLASFKLLFTDDLYLAAWLSSLRIAAISTLVTLLLGYPMAYAIARAESRRRPLLLMLVVLPFWTSFLIRVYAWIGLLVGRTASSTSSCAGSGLATDPGTILGTEWAIYLGIVYAYLPFMVLPLYASLEKLDWSLLEAASDLGARPLRPPSSPSPCRLSLPGIVAGCLLVFIPAVGEFVIPRPARRHADADDRQGPVGRVLHQLRLAARLGGGDLPAGAAGRADPRCSSASSSAAWSAVHEGPRALRRHRYWRSATPFSTCRSRW